MGPKSVIKTRILSILRRVFFLFDKSAQRKIILMILFQLIATTLDIVALGLLGVLISTGLDYVQNKSAAFPDTIITTLNLSSFEFETIFTLLTAAVIALFLCRTMIALFGLRRIYLFLGRQSTVISEDIIKKFLSTKPSYFLTKKSQEVLFGVSNGVDSLVLSFAGGVVVVITESFFLFVIVCTLFIFQFALGLTTLLFFGFALAVMYKFLSVKSRNLARMQSKETVNFNTRFIELNTLYRERFLRGNPSSIPSSLIQARRNSLEARAKLMLIPNVSKYILEFTMIIGGTFLALGQIVLNDSSTAMTSLAIFLASATRIVPSAIRIQSALLAIKQSEGTASITLDLLLEFSSETQRLFERDYIFESGDEFVPSVHVQIDEFKYEKDDKAVLEDINFEVLPGQFIAIVGDSGSGKTTLVDLILGMKELQSGSVLISNRSPIEAIANWPGRVAYVPQDIYITSDSLVENIALSERTAVDFDQVAIAALRAGVTELIKLENVSVSREKYSNLVNLSGGEKQRIGIARALYSSPQLIILDEATSALDAKTEKLVTEAILEMKGQVTLIVVAHRLSTVKNADLVLFLDKGKLSAKGTFAAVRKAVPKFDEQAKLLNL
jgi:ABC-type multidrug transport system fused ATPase/permease subunit